MTGASVFFVVCFLLVALIAWVAVVSAGRTWRKAAAVLALLALIPAGYLATTELLGRPKPASIAVLEAFMEYRKVIAYDVHEGEAIFLWFDMGGGEEPRVFAFPYDKRTVSELQDAAERAESLASDLMARLERSEGRARTDLEFTSEVEFHRQLPSKPDDAGDDVLVFDPASADEPDGGEP